MQFFFLSNIALCFILDVIPADDLAPLADAVVVAPSLDDPLADGVAVAPSLDALAHLSNALADAAGARAPLPDAVVVDPSLEALVPLSDVVAPVAGTCCVSETRYACLYHTLCCFDCMHVPPVKL